MDINIEKIKELADIALDKQLSELIVQDGEKSVTIKLPQVQNATVVHSPGHPQPVVYAPPAPPPVPEIPSSSSATSGHSPANDSITQVTAPMVGTFYIAPSPDSPPFVTVGQQVAPGQTLCIIEAMKMMNQLESDLSGKIVKVLVKDGEPVEYGQPLLLIDTAT